MRVSVKSRVLRGSAWNFSGYFATQLVRLGSNLILTRLLFPEAFGLMALVHIFMHGLAMFSDVGLRPAIIQSKRGHEDAFLNTAWTVHVVRGFVIWVLACIGSWPLSAIYAEPALASVLPIAALTAVIGGFQSTSIFTVERDLMFGRLTILELLTQLVGIATMICIASIWPSVWSLVIGGLLASTIKTLLSHKWLATDRNRLYWDESASRELIRFGRWIMVSSVFAFSAQQADRLILGKLVSIETLGIYSIAMILAMLPQELVRRTTSVLLPAFSVYARTQRKELKAKVRQARNIVLPASVFVVLAIALFAPTFFETLYDARYHSAGWMAQALCLSVWFAILSDTSMPALLAIGRTLPQATAQIVDFALTIIGCVMGYMFFDLLGLILGYSLGRIGKVLVIVFEMRRAKLDVLSQDLLFSLVLAFFVSIAWFDWGFLSVDAWLAQYGVNPHQMAAVFSLMICGVWAIRAILSNLSSGRTGLA